MGSLLFGALGLGFKVPCYLESVPHVSSGLGFGAFGLSEHRSPSKESRQSQAKPIPPTRQLLNPNPKPLIVQGEVFLFVTVTLVLHRSNVYRYARSAIVETFPKP